MSAAQAKALAALAEPIVAQFDADLEDVLIRQAGKRRLVRVVVDAGGGLTLDLVASISRAVSQALDDSDVLGNAPFVLEVTSPGVDRPLRLPRHWQRAEGRIVRVSGKSGDTREGRLVEVGTDEVSLDLEGVVTTIALADIVRAVVQVEFSHHEDADGQGSQDEDVESADQDDDEAHADAANADDDTADDSVGAGPAGRAPREQED